MHKTTNLPGAAGCMLRGVNNGPPHDEVRPVHQKSTCITQVTFGAYVVQIWSRNPQNVRQPSNFTKREVQNKSQVVSSTWSCWSCNALIDSGCSRDTYPESHMTKYTSIRRMNSLGGWTRLAVSSTLSRWVRGEVFLLLHRHPTPSTRKP